MCSDSPFTAKPPVRCACARRRSRAGYSGHASTGRRSAPGRFRRWGQPPSPRLLRRRESRVPTGRVLSSRRDHPVTEMPHIEDEQRAPSPELLRSFDAPTPGSSLYRRVRVADSPHTVGSRRALSPVAACVGSLPWVSPPLVAVASRSCGGCDRSRPGRWWQRTYRSASARQPRQLCVRRRSPRRERAGRTTRSLPSPSTACRSPSGSERFGWRSTGSRTDRVDGRLLTTVFYGDSSGRRIGYAILAGTPAPGSAVAWSRGAVACPTGCSVENGAAVVTWLRDGHLCVVSGRGVSSAMLLRLASWSDHDATAS